MNEFQLHFLHGRSSAKGAILLKSFITEVFTVPKRVQRVHENGSRTSTWGKFGHCPRAICTVISIMLNIFAF